MKKIRTFMFIVLFVVAAIALVIFWLSEEEVKTTALLSDTAFFCYATEWSEPYAYFHFAYQNNGEITYLKTKTTCDDLIAANVSNNRQENPALIGEQIKLYYSDFKPVKLQRENGDIYDVEETDEYRKFFSSSINPSDNLKYYKNNSPAEVLIECLTLEEVHAHDRCLSYQAALQNDLSICEMMHESSNQNLCKTWLQNIESGEINK